MAKKYGPDFELLIKVLKDLENFLPYLVLVGGWVPFLYVHYLWDSSTEEPMRTTDIDFGLRNVSFTGKETIADRIIKKNYGERHLEIGKDIPFIPIAKLEKGARAEVEFISDQKSSDEWKRKLLGREIFINTLPFVDVLLEKTVSLMIEGIQINVPHPNHYVFHKFLTFPKRLPENKKAKDLYYAYFVLRFHPNSERFSNSVSKLIHDHPMGRLGRKNIRAHFEDVWSTGPGLISEATKFSPLATLGMDIRDDAFKRIRSLILNR